MFDLFKYLSTGLWLRICLISSMTVYCNLHRCSDIYGDKALGSFDDSCTCNQSSNNVSLIVCTEWSSQPFIFEVNELEMKVNGLNGTIPFEFLEWFVPLVTSKWSTTIYSLAVSNFCNDPTIVSNHLNLSIFLNNYQYDPMILKLPNNCLQSITSSTNNIYSFTQLDLSFNKLTQIPKFYYELDLLAEYDLSHNSINIISKTDFDMSYDVMTLNLANNNLSSLTQDVFNNLRSLEELDLSHNFISDFPENLFNENTTLKKLDMSYNKLTNLSKFILSRYEFLEELNFSHNKIKHINLRCESINRLKVLRLDSNNIVKINIFGLYQCIYLKELVLANNSLKEIGRLTTTIEIGTINYDISNNKLTALSLPLMSYVMTANTFDTSNNCIKNYNYDHDPIRNYVTDNEIANYKCSNCCLNNIQYNMFKGITRKVDISINNITKLDDGTLKEFRNLREIVLSHNKITHVNLTQFQAIYKHKMIYFDLSYNPFVCDCRLNKFIRYLKHNQNETFTFHTKNNFCSSPPVLNGTPLITINKNLLCDYPEDCPDHCHCFIEDIDNILFVLIDCTNSNLTHFPNIVSYGPAVAIQLNLSRNQISSLPSKNDPIWTKIKILDLSHNRIDSIKNMTVLPILTTLHLNNNSLSEFDYQIASLSHVAHLKLANNPLKCDCEMSKIVIKSSAFEDKYEMSCVRDKTMYNFTNSDEICINLSGFNWLLLFLPFIIIVIVIFVIVILFIKYKSEILYYMFSKGICLKFVCEEDIDADKAYDAFVSYSSEDEDWITDFLVPGMESGNPSYNLCLHNRDWVGGEFITDQIVKSVESSKRTIIVLTDNYLKSKWSRLEFDVAYQQGLKDQVRRVMVIVPNEVPDLSQIDNEFKTFITLTTYIQANKPHFWRKLRASMPRTKNTLQPSTTRNSVYLISDVSQQLHNEDVALSNM
uniref:TIR domain-containing protein n=1 Tax=Strigamia maritima TaxID=126957 RepID=T1IK30_STRMM